MLLRDHFAERIRTKRRMADGEDLAVKIATPPIIERKDADREIVMVANTDDVDSDGEVVVPDGALQDSYFFDNRNVFVDHEVEESFAVAKVRSWYKRPASGQARRWEVRMKFGTHPVAEAMWQIARDGLFGSSVGFLRLRAGPPSPDEKSVPRWTTARSFVRAWNWVELSVTCLPCNAKCQTIGVEEMADAKAAMLDGMVCKSRIRREAAYALGLPQPKAMLRKTIVIVG